MKKRIKELLLSKVIIKASLTMLCLIFSTNINATTLWVGESYTCDATSAVMGLTSDVSWTTNGGYFSMSGSGFYRKVTITQFFSGSATITCSWKYRLYSNDTWKHQSKTWTFTCQENPVYITPTSMTLKVGESSYVSYSHKYSNSYTSAANAYFSSTNSSIASVSNSGLVTAKSPGTAYINVYSKIAAASNAPYCKVTVIEASKPTSISLPEQKEINVGRSVKLTPELTPSDASCTYTWKSDNPEIASVSSGIVTGISVGNATITVTTSNGLSASCTIIVKEKNSLTSENKHDKIKFIKSKFEYLINRTHAHYN